ncbi:MAG TPA: hypothetical protein VJX91_10505 [Candidatus Eisenbacteria bacterium]|nr:hypothetical protein [Candidatus Eisenbacteria bacterium]
MNPEQLPLLALLIAGVFVGAVAVRDLLARRWIVALRGGGVALLALALGFAGGTRLGKHDRPRISRLPGLVPLNRTAGTSTALLLGGVSVHVVPQNRCVLALDGTPFLTLDSLRTGLLVTCSAALPEDNEGPIPWRERGVAAWISQNAIFTQTQEIRSSRPDPHTIVVRRGDDELLRVRDVAPGTIEIEGGLWAEDPAGSGQSVRLRNGVRWPGGSIPVGTVDLTSQGEGMIDLQSDGAIRVIPNSPAHRADERRK